MDQLLRRHYERVHAVCRRITGSDSDAADAAQEAMIAIVRAIPRFDGRSSFGTWAYRIATNASLDELRRRRRRPALADTRGRSGEGESAEMVEHADPDLYQGRQVILTPIERTLTANLDKATQLWTALGCHVKQMSPEAHDAAYAAVSHLPHLIAFALMNAVVDQEHGKQFLSLAGPGFRDFTRIAASDPSVWRDILVSNREELIAQSRQFQRALHAFESAISASNPEALEALIEKASQARSKWRMSAHKSQS